MLDETYQMLLSTELPGGLVGDWPYHIRWMLESKLEFFSQGIQKICGQTQKCSFCLLSVYLNCTWTSWEWIQMSVFACVSSASWASDCGWLRSTSPSPPGSEVHSIQWLLSCSALWESRKVWAVTSYSLPYVVLQGYNCYLKNSSRHVGIVTRLIAAILEALIFWQQLLWRPKCTSWPYWQKLIYIVHSKFKIIFIRIVCLGKVSAHSSQPTAQPWSLLL